MVRKNDAETLVDEIALIALKTLLLGISSNEKELKGLYHNPEEPLRSPLSTQKHREWWRSRHLSHEVTQAFKSAIKEKGGNRHTCLHYVSNLQGKVGPRK